MQLLQLNDSGISQISRSDPSDSRVAIRASGNPIKGPPVITPAVWFKFDEGIGDRTKEQITQSMVTIAGDKVFWKHGVSGTAIEFDGYHTLVSLPSAQIRGKGPRTDMRRGYPHREGGDLKKANRGREQQPPQRLRIRRADR